MIDISSELYDTYLLFIFFFSENIHFSVSINILNTFIFGKHI